jgi:GT2 family glycosyltransferase
MPKTDIIIPCWNNAEFTERCLSSIVKNTRPDTYRLILIDNGSTDYTPAIFKQYSEAVESCIIKNETNLGFAKAVNQGLKHSMITNKLRYKVILNNDTEVPYNWLEQMVDVASKNVSGMVGALSSAFTEPHYYKNRDRIEAISNIQRVYFHCVLIKPEVIEAIGYLDEDFEYAYCEDDDYCQRAINMGFKLTYALDVVVKHYHMASTKNLPNIDEIYERNLAHLKEKYPKLVFDKRIKVHIAVPTSTSVSPHFAKIIPNTFFDPRYKVSFDFYPQSPVDVNRNYIVKKFLGTDGDILCMIDSDVVPPGDFLSAIALDLDVVSLSCLNILTGRDGQDAPHIVYCVADKDKDGNYVGLHPSRMTGVQKIARAGFGCVFIKRTVLEAITPQWFKQTYTEDYTLETSEDYYFCDRAIEKGFSVWYDFTHLCDHRKNNVSLLEIMQLIQRERALAILDYKNRVQGKTGKIIRPGRA